MKNRIASRVGFAYILFLALGLTTIGSAPVNLSVTLRVTSTTSENILSFDAAYLLGGKTGTLQFGKYHTPYEMSISVEDQYVAGLFSKTGGGEGSIDVEIILKNNGKKLNSIRGSGSMVVLSTSGDINGSNENYSVRTF